VRLFSSFFLKRFLTLFFSQSVLLCLYKILPLSPVASVVFPLIKRLPLRPFLRPYTAPLPYHLPPYSPSHSSTSPFPARKLPYPLL
jgi:hypothetical protein